VIEAETCRREGWNSIEDPGYGKGYIAAESVWNEFLDPIRQLGPAKGMTVILIGHTEIKNFDDPASSTYSRYQPNLQKRAADLIKAASDIIAFVNHRVTIKKEKGAFGAEKKEADGNGVRVIYLEERPGFIAKTAMTCRPKSRSLRARVTRRSRNSSRRRPHNARALRPHGNEHRRGSCGGR
jgi:hypothetical protein